MNTRATAKIGMGLLVGLLTVVTGAHADTYGRQERARIAGPVNSIEVVARLDSAAAQSSLHAVDVKYFNRDGKTWVRFTIDNGSVLPGNRVTLEREVLKDVKLKQRGGGVEHRPLVRLGYCIGRMPMDSEVSLSDRSSYTAPLVIGSADLRKLGSVDPAREYTREPDCAATVPAEPTSPPKSLGKPAAGPALTSLNARTEVSPYRCDGRTRCNQMHSCDEAKFFLANCPNTEMDGEGHGNGIPCERQWCH